MFVILPYGPVEYVCTRRIITILITCSWLLLESAFDKIQLYPSGELTIFPLKRKFVYRKYSNYARARRCCFVLTMNGTTFVYIASYSSHEHGGIIIFGFTIKRAGTKRARTT